MDTATNSHCSVKARILPTGMEATVTAMYASHRQSLRSVSLDVLQSAQFGLSESEQNTITKNSGPSIQPDTWCWPIEFRPDCVLFGLRPEKLRRLQ